MPGIKFRTNKDWSSLHFTRYFLNDKYFNIFMSDHDLKSLVSINILKVQFIRKEFFL